MTPESEALRPLATEATALLKALAHPARLMICCQLRDREMAVSELERVLDIKQPNLSRELGKLREEGLVQTRREAKVVFYRLTDPRAAAIIEAMCHIMRGDMEGAVPARKDSPPQREYQGGYGVFAKVESE